MPTIPGGGTTAGGYTENPAFSPNIRTVWGGAGADGSYQGGSPLFRGRMETKVPVNGSLRRLNFLFNPSTVTWNGGVDTDAVGDSTVLAAGDLGQYMMPMNQGVDFALLFDRTYETWNYDESVETSRLGVMCDVKHLYAMLGVLGDGIVASGIPTVTTSVVPGITVAPDAGIATSYTPDFKAGLATPIDISTIDDITPTSFIQYVQMRVIFGHNLTYHGVIESVSVAYTHFTNRMIPNRCAVSVGMKLFPVSREEVDAVDSSISPGVVVPGTGKAGR